MQSSMMFSGWAALPVLHCKVAFVIPLPHLVGNALLEPLDGPGGQTGLPSDHSIALENVVHCAGTGQLCVPLVFQNFSNFDRPNGGVLSSIVHNERFCFWRCLPGLAMRRAALIFQSFPRQISSQPFVSVGRLIPYSRHSALLLFSCASTRSTNSFRIWFTVLSFQGIPDSSRFCLHYTF